jgi:hypothetical protein
MLPLEKWVEKAVSPTSDVASLRGAFGGAYERQHTIQKRLGIAVSQQLVHLLDQDDEFSTNLHNQLIHIHHNAPPLRPR